jgi:hypothetical protein
VIAAVPRQRRVAAWLRFAPASCTKDIAESLTS